MKKFILPQALQKQKKEMPVSSQTMLFFDIFVSNY